MTHPNCQISALLVKLALVESSNSGGRYPDVPREPWVGRGLREVAFEDIPKSVSFHRFELRQYSTWINRESWKCYHCSVLNPDERDLQRVRSAVRRQYVSQ